MLNGWAEFAAAVGVFLASHALPLRPPLRPWLLGRLGRRGFLAGYTAQAVSGARGGAAPVPMVLGRLWPRWPPFEGLCPRG